MIFRFFMTFLLMTLTMSSLNAGDGDQEASKLLRVVEQTSEESIFARVKLSNGLIYVKRAPADKAFSGEFFFVERPPVVAYEVIGSQGRLAVKFAEKNSKARHESEFDYDEDDNHYDIELDQLYDNECHLNFSDNLPLSIKMDLGVTKGELDLGGLKLESCKISAAVSQSTITFHEPNKTQLSSLDIENGFGKMSIQKLGNANCANFDFEAGVGSYKLDFGGQLRNNMHANIEMGVGKLKIYLPAEAGVRIRLDKSFFCSFDIDQAFKDGDYYLNDKWGTDAPQLDLDIESGVGSISVEWIDSE